MIPRQESPGVPAELAEDFRAEEEGEEMTPEEKKAKLGHFIWMLTETIGLRPSDDETLWLANELRAAWELLQVYDESCKWAGEVPRLRAIEAAAKDYVRQYGNLRRDFPNTMLWALAELVDPLPPKRPVPHFVEPRAGLRIKWLSGAGQERRGEIMGRLQGGSGKWIVNVDIAPDNANYRELPEKWGAE